MAEEPSGDAPEDGRTGRSGTAGDTEGGFEFGAVSDDDWERVPIGPSDDHGDRPVDEPPARADETADGGDPYGPEPRSTPIIAGDPSLENAVFVALGAVAMVLVIVRLVSIAFA